MLWIIAFVVFLFFAFKIYLKTTTGWCRSQTCLVGKTTIVTGANTGIGYETALDFAKRGARVILACRDQKRAEEARDKIIDETENKNVVVKLIDMASFKSVRAFAKDILETEDRLDILVNNAGAVVVSDRRSEDGQVLLMQINYLGPFLLTLLLIGLMKRTKKSRIVNVSSIGANWWGSKNFNVETLDKYPGEYFLYSHTKLCNILFTIELAKRLEGTDITTYSLHPGVVKTDIFRHTHGVIRIIIDFLKNYFFKTSEEGAQTNIYCSVAKGIEKYNGKHFENCHRVPDYKTTQVPGLSNKLWNASIKLVDLKPEEIQI